MNAKSKTLLPIEPDDYALVERAKEGDDGAFEQLVRRHQDMVYRVALRMLGTEAEAQDASQEAFIDAWRALRAFRGHAAFSTWLYRIVVRRCIRQLRRTPATESLDAFRGRPSADAGPEEQAESRQRLAAAARAILSLDVELRAPFVLRYVEGLAYEDISQVLDLSRGAVRSRLYRARKRVLQSLKERP